MGSILVIEDEQGLRLSISRVLGRAGHTVVQAGLRADAADLLQKGEFDLIISDVNLPDGDGLDLIQRARADGFDGVAVVITAFGTIQTAVQAMRRGADDFLQKPLKMEELPLQVEKWLRQRRVIRRLELYERLEKTREAGAVAAPVGHSRAWEETLKQASLLATIPLQTPGEDDLEVGGATLPTVLLLGETGSGKGVLARHIHASATGPGKGSRDHGIKGLDPTMPRSHCLDPPPFVHVNCSALPPTLVEAELFGHERGAFTDAREARAGLFEMADGGTIFLDEIGEMPLELQAKLLLVVEQGRFRRVGGVKDRTVRVRVIAASNADLEHRVIKGTFRGDLLYRLNAYTVRVPPLRSREGDALLIARATLDRVARRFGRPRLCLGEDAQGAIAAYPWPGNVRELINTVQRAAMFCEPGEGRALTAADLGLSGAGVGRAADQSQGGESALGADGLPIFDFERGNCKADDIEKSLILQALERTGGNVSRAARLVGLTRASMRYRMERHGLKDPLAEVAE